MYEVIFKTIASLVFLTVVGWFVALVTAGIVNNNRLASDLLIAAGCTLGLAFVVGGLVAIWASD